MPDDLTIFYVADVHGSDTCFRKWLNAGRFYGADVLIIGGDLTGKVLLPIYPAGRNGSGWVSTWRERTVRLDTRREVDDLVRTARKAGAYGFVTTPDEVAAIQGSLDVERDVFLRLKREALAEWIALADERLAGGTIRAFVMPGNDDPPEIDEVLADSRSLRNVNGEVTELWPGVTMASRGESTPTPWSTPRELSEEDLGAAVGAVVDELPAEGVTIWNLHMPPHATSIDSAPKLDGQLRVQYDGGGEPVMVPVGSTAVRQLVTDRQPTVALHGHIHEGRGRYRIGRTVGVNPGSQYQDGVLLGVLLRVSTRQGLRDVAFTAG